MNELSMKCRAYCLLAGAAYGGYETVHRVVSSIEGIGDEIVRAGRDQIEARRELREAVEKILGLVQSIEAHQRRVDDGSRKRLFDETSVFHFELRLPAREEFVDQAPVEKPSSMDEKNDGGFQRAVESGAPH